MTLNLSLNQSFFRHVNPHIPAWIRLPIKEALQLAQRGGEALHRRNFGGLPDDFIGEERVDIRHKERITARDFPNAGPLMWLDRPDAAQAIEQRLQAGTLTPEQAEHCLHFARHGFVTLPKLVSEEVIDAAMTTYVRGREDGTLASTDGDRRFLNPHLIVPEVLALMRAPGIMSWVERLLGRPAIAFQSIGAQWGSEQLEHSDAIHMTTYPLGYMVAAWVACEDIHEDAGPLMYYPGSHKLPYYLSHEAGISPTEFQQRSYACYADKYEPLIQNLKRTHGLSPKYLLVKKGDVLLWHHNLIHGGSRIKNAELTRKSFVFHYFARGVFCYQDLTSSRFPADRLR